MENNPAEQPIYPVQPVTPTPVQASQPVQTPAPNEPQGGLPLGKIALIIVGIIVLLGILTGGYLLVKGSSQKPTPTPVAVTTPTPSPIDQTADWKTYINSVEGFLFKYPSDLKMITDEASTVSPTFQKDNANDCPALFTVMKFSTKEFNSGQVGIPPITFGHKTNERGNYTYALVGFLYEGGCAVLSQESKKQALDVFDGIYSTFKFTNSNSNFQTYTNSQFGFSFQYPNDWKTTTAFDPSTPYLKLNLGLIQSNRERSSSTVTPIYVMQYDNPNNLSVSDWQTAYNKNLPSQHEFYSSSDTPTTVAGLKAYVNPKAGCEPLLCYQTIVMAKNNVFIFYNVNLDNMVAGENFAANQKIYDVIISSLKFNQ